MKLPAILVTLGLALLAGCGSDKSTTSSPVTSVVGQTTTSLGGAAGTSTGFPIPESAAIDAITSDLTKPGAADLTAKCNVFATVFLANSVTPGNEAAVMDALKSLADVVRPIDSAVADALAGHAGAAAAWCKAKGMTNA
jgi:hypothetical protein